jgi:hypothetical protein
MVDNTSAISGMAAMAKKLARPDAAEAVFGLIDELRRTA